MLTAFTPDLTPTPPVVREFCGGCDEELHSPEPCPGCSPTDAVDLSDDAGSHSPPSGVWIVLAVGVALAASVGAMRVAAWLLGGK